VVGPISFMGLIVANLSRQLLRTYRHTQLVAGSVLFGMVILVAGQLLVEVSLKKQQLRGVSFLCQHKKPPCAAYSSCNSIAIISQ